MQRLPNVVPAQVRGLATAISRPPLSSLNAVARAKAEQITAQWKGTNASGENVKNYIGGQFVDSKAEKWIDLVDPVRPYRPPMPGGANGLRHSRPRPCFHVSRKRPPQSLNRPLKLPRRHSRPGVALPSSHDNDSLSSTVVHSLPPPCVVYLITAFLACRLRYAKTQTPLPTVLFLSKERPSRVRGLPTHDRHPT